MAKEERPKSEGLKWRKRAKGPDVPYWFPDPQAVEDGYTPKSVNLQSLISTPGLLVERCEIEQKKLLSWKEGKPKRKMEFDGTFSSLFKAYQHDRDSSFHETSSNTQASYSSCIKTMLDEHIGAKRVDNCDGRDVKNWFKHWRLCEDDPTIDMLPRARMMLAVVKAAISFGIICKYKGCSDFKTILSELEFPVPDAREHAPTAEQIIAARKAAHAAGRPRRALVYALQFETTLRQQDIVGQWVPMWDPRPSTIHFKGKKWIGIQWSQIDEAMILRKVEPSKTHKTTKVKVAFDLAACPMVMEELQGIIPADGPIIIDERTGRPYRKFSPYWRADFKAAGLPPEIWGRDLRASGITEGDQAGASREDRKKIAGHAKEETTERYERDNIVAHRRVMAKRVAFRNEKG
jgi:integrase